MTLQLSTETWAIITACAFALGFLLGRSSSVKVEGAIADRGGAPSVSAEKAFAQLAPDAKAEVDTAIRNRRKIAAIKALRAATGLGLKDAKDAVEARERALKSGIAG